MTLIDDDKIKIVFGILAKIGRIIRAAHKGLEDGKKDAAVGGHAAIFANLAGIDAHQGVFRKSVESVKGLVG